MEIQNASTTPSKSNQLRNVNTVRWESWNVTSQPWEINNRKSEVIAFVVMMKSLIFVKLCDFMTPIVNPNKFKSLLHKNHHRKKIITVFCLVAVQRKR